ncbi:MAG: LytTR family DNA-binding domain-containing protein [Saprospiraceae bacterium]
MQERIKCLIVEDEPLAAEVLSDYVNEVPHLELLGICEDAIYTSSFLKERQVDLLFLDLHLPKLKGLDFLKTLVKPPKVILTTAYHQYALQGYEHNVVDYLLKPVAFERFLMAVQKVDFKDKVEDKNDSSDRGGMRFKFFRVNKRNVKVFLDDILYVESLKEYVSIHTRKERLVTKFQIGVLEAELKDLNLIRIHRSFLVAKDKIEAYSAAEVEVNGQQLPIGRTYREEVLAALSHYT